MQPVCIDHCMMLQTWNSVKSNSQSFKCQSLKYQSFKPPGVSLLAFYEGKEDKTVFFLNPQDMVVVRYRYYTFEFGVIRNLNPRGIKEFIVEF